MCAADQGRIREGFAEERGGKGGCEVFEFTKGGANLDACPCIRKRRRREVIVEDDGQDSLCATSILDRLGCEEQVIGVDSLGVISAI